MKRLTWEEIGEKYPMQWVGLVDVIYRNNDGISVESAVVKYSDKTKFELTMMEVNGENVAPVFTTPDDAWQFTIKPKLSGKGRYGNGTGSYIKCGRKR